MKKINDRTLNEKTWNDKRWNYNNKENTQNNNKNQLQSIFL